MRVLSPILIKSGWDLLNSRNFVNFSIWDSLILGNDSIGTHTFPNENKSLHSNNYYALVVPEIYLVLAWF